MTHGRGRNTVGPLLPNTRSDIATYSRTPKYIIHLFPGRRLADRIVVIVDSSSIIKLSICGVVSTAARSCRYKLLGLLETGARGMLGGNVDEALFVALSKHSRHKRWA